MTVADDTNAPDPGSLRPQVAKASRSRRLGLLAAGAGALVVVALVGFNQPRRTPPASADGALGTAGGKVSPANPPPSVSGEIAAGAFPDELARIEAAARGQALTATPPSVTGNAPPVPAPPQVSLAGLGGQTNDLAGDAERREHIRSPAVIIDFGAPTTGGAPAAGSGGLKPIAAGSGPKLSGDEQFAERVTGGEPDRARASAMHAPAYVVPQGAIVPAVLETALNSDLPGYARAVVSRDVRGFDGSRVLIPRGSRLVGQYRNGVSQGQSRAFLVWTRLIRPDGASIQIGSPAADALGRAGLTGKVDRHFFEIFGDAFLLSVIDSGTASLFRGSGNQIFVGSSQEALSMAAASVATPPTISPTIKVAQGEPVRVFVARDLDFSITGGGAP